MEKEVVCYVHLSQFLHLVKTYPCVSLTLKKKKKGLEQEDFGAGMKQLEQQLERQGQKWSWGGWALQQVTLQSLALKMKKNQYKHRAARIPNWFMLVKGFKVMPLSTELLRSSSVTARNFYSPFGRGKGPEF